MGRNGSTFRADLGGRVALVMGASGGLGSQFARVLVANGAAVALAARRIDRLEALRDEIRAQDGRAYAVELDVTSPESVTEAFQAIETGLGLVDVVINNPGVSGQTGPLLSTEDDDFEGVMAVNLAGARRVAVEAARRLVAAGRGGSIINIASITGLRVAGGVAAYVTSKAALVQLTRVMAPEWARHGIRVNAIAPGYIETDMNREFLTSEAGQALIRRVPPRRLGRPQDLEARFCSLRARLRPS